MQTWIIEPHDSFIARDGRPFGLIAGVRAASMPFPFPSVTTGGVRTRDGLDLESVFDTCKENIDRVKNLNVQGALLVEIDNNENVAQWFAHAPADAVLLDTEDKDKNKALVRHLAPQNLQAGAATNLPDDLMPLYLPKVKDSNGKDVYDKSKPHGYPPRFWKWEEFEKWLTTPKDFKIEDLHGFGIEGLSLDERSHVAIESASQTGEEGKLFQTRGLEFTRQKQGRNLETATRLALALNTDATNISKGVASLGGERRLVCWRKFQGAKQNILNSQCPTEIKESILMNRACRVVLLTPAYFEQGWKPTWIIANGNVQLKAAAIQRTQVISGWDFEFVGTSQDGKVIHGRPKPTRRLVPAGTVFFFKFNGSESEVENWIKTTWMSCISDDDTRYGTTPRKDGFGLAVLGTWIEGKDITL
jgi:CRISPR-associated protein Cmr3